MISNIDKTESERLNQKLRDIVTGKYQSPAKQRNNFFSTNLNHVQNEDSNLSIVPNGTKDSNGVKHYTLEKNAPAYLPGAEKLFTVRNNIVENQIKSINKQSERNEYYTQKYKDTPKTYEGYMNHAQYVSSDEREWLEKQAEQYATAEDYKKEADKAKADYNYYKILGEKVKNESVYYQYVSASKYAQQKQSDLQNSADKIEKRMNEAQDSERIAESKGKEKYYEEKYKDTPKTYEGYMKHAPYVSEEERQWLESQADEFATSEDYKKEIEKAKAEHAYLYNIYKKNESNGTTASKSDRKIDDGIISKLNEISKYESKLRKKEYEEKTKDILESDARVRSIVQQYYAYQKNSEQRKSDNDEAVRIDLKRGNKYTPEQEQRIVENFNNLANEGYDPKALYTYYDRAMQEQASIENLQKIQQDAMNNPVGASAWSVLDNAVGSVGDAFKYIGAGIAEEVTGEYQWINTYDTAAARVNTVRSTVSDKIGADIGNETAGKVASFLYQTGMSLADFAATLPLNLVPGVGTGLQMVLLSTEAGTAAAKDAYENTGKASNALMTGVAAGIAEAFFEKFSIENLKAFEAVSPDSLKSVLKNAGKQMFTEASEEGLTTIANTMTDCIINGNMSSIALEYQGYIDEGYTKDEATAKCAENFGKQVLLDAAGGAVSGGVLGGTVSGISYAKGKINSNIDMKKSAEEIGKEVMSDENFDINLLLEQAKNSGSEKAVSIAKSIEKKMSGNKNYKVNSVDVGNLMKLIGAESLKNTISENTDVKNDGVTANEGNINTVSKEEITEHIKYNFGNSHKNGITATDNKGKSVVIVGFESSARYYGEADNKVRVIADDGRVYNADSLTFNLPEYQSLMNAAKNFDTNGAGTLVQEYGDYVNFKGKESDINNYIDTFTQLYEAGKMGARYNRVAAMKYYGKYIDAIGPQRAMLAVEAGNKDSDLFFNNEEKLARIDRSSNVKANVYVEKSAEETVNLDEGTRLALEKLSEMTGKEIILTADMDENGRIDFRNGKIYIRASLDGNYILPVAMHESMHSFRRESPKDYRLIRNFVVDYLYASGHDVMKMADNVKINYGDRLTTNEDCIEEIVCNSIMAIAGDESAMHKALQVAKADEGVLQKLANAIKNLASKIKEFIITHTTNEAAQAFVNDVKALDKLAEMFSDAADNIKAKSEEVITNEQKNNTDKGVENVKYSINKGFAKEYDNWDKKSTGFAFKVGTTSTVLHKLGVNNKTIYWDATKIKKIKEKHPEMTDSIIKQVPNILENPIIVMESNTVSGRLVLFGDVYDSKNNPVLVALELNPTEKGGKSLNIIKIASAYGKDVDLQGFINKSKILYVEPNKERTHNWLSVNRLKLPLPSTRFGFFNNSISQSPKNVNTKNDESSNDIKYSIGYTTDNNPVVVINDDILKGVKKSDWVKTVKNTISDKFSNGIPIKGRFIKVNRITRNEYTNSKYSKNKKNYDTVIYKDKFKTANNLDEIIIASTNYVNEDLKHTRKDSFKEFARGDVLIRVGSNDYSSKVIVGFTKGNEMVLYDIINFVPEKLDIKKIDTQYRPTTENVESDRTSVSITNSISENRNNVNTKNDESSNDIKYSMGGLKAETADKSALEKAMELEKDGTDSEKIRKETGWFKGYDGKWRFEIDNSELEFKTDIEKNRAAAIELAKMKVKSAELEEKIVNDTATKAEENEYYNLDEKMIEYRKGVKLSDVINHPKLFEAYPQLKNVDVYYEISSVNRGVYSSNGNVIMLNPMHTIDEQKEAIIHEIQHAIQGIENFANGSNLEYWKNLGYSDEEAMAMYYNTAGEREARDVSARRDYNAEQRKNIRPDIDRKDVVFANSGDAGYLTDKDFTKYDNLETLDDKEIKVYNKRGWAYGLFNREDMKLLNEKFSELDKRLNGKTDNMLADGTRVVEINNKIVSIGGTYNDPEIYSVFEINAYHEYEAERIKDDIKYVQTGNGRNRYSFEELGKLIENYKGKENVRFYSSTDYSYIRGRTEKGARAISTGDFSRYGYNKESNIRGTSDANAKGEVSAVQLDEDTSDIKYATDDTINDWLDDESTPQGIDYEKAVEKNPVIAVAKIYKSAAQTAKSGLAQGKNVKLDEKEYLRIAGSIMQTYGIKGKYNPNYKKELASQLKNFVDSIGKKDANFTDLFEELVNDCKGGILLSGEYDTTLMKDEREFVLDLINDKTLFIRPRDIQQIEDDYGSVANYRKKMFGKTYVAVKNKESGKGYYIEDVITHIEENYPYLLYENADGDMGYLWLEDLVNNVLKPKYKNPYFEGENSFYETPETAAIQMAFECASKIINAKTEKLKADTKADKKLIKEFETSQKEAINIATEIAEAKNKQYRQELKEAKERNIKLWKRNAKLSKQMKSLSIYKLYEDQKHKNTVLREKNADSNKIIEAQKAIIASHYKTIREEYNENREKTLYLNKLGKMCDRLTKRLDGKAKNNEYIPDNLKGPIIDVLSCFTVKNAKNATPGYFGEWNRLKEVGERVAELAEEYNNMKPEPTPSTDLEKKEKEKEKPQNTFIDIESISYKEPVNKQLKNLAEMLKGQNIYTLTSHELSAIYDTMQRLDESLRDAVQIIVDGRKQNFKELANEAMQEVKNNKARVDYSKMKNVLAAPAKQLGKSFVATHLDPVRYGRMLSNYHDDSIIYKMFSDLHKGENHAIALQHKAISRIKEVTIKYSDEVKKIQNEDVKEFDFRDVETGRRVPITKGVLLAIYLTDRQKSGHIHLLGGTEETYANEAGHYTVLPNLELSNKKLKRTANENSHKVRFNVESLKRIEKYVQNDKVLMELATAISEVYNQTLKQEINEVSMAKYGMKIATVKDYYPLKVDPNAGKYEKNLKTEFHDTRLKSRGFTKQRQWSDTPIVIDDALRNFVKQVKSVSEYCGLLIPIENFKKVYNYSDGSATLQSTIKERYGVSAEHYIDKLIGDLQNRADTTDRTILDKIQSNFMGMKIAFNFGSMIKQVSAFPLANRYFGAKNVSLAAMNLFRNKVDFDLYNKYTSYLWYRKEGNGTVIGELSKEMSLTSKGMGFLDIVSKMDNRVVSSLLYAAELHVEQTTDLKKGTDAFYREVARQFEKCIDETQPNNMVTSKPQYMRNKNLRQLSLNAFRSQNMAIGNTIFDSFFEMKARMADDKINSTAESKAAKKAAVLKFVSCCSGAISANLLLGALSVLSSVILYHHWDDLFDDEGNISGEKIALNYLDEVLNGIFGSFAMGDYLYSAVSSAIDIGKTYYGLQAMSVDSINDMVKDLIIGKALDALKTLIDCLGYPGTNFARFGLSIYAYYNDVAKGSGRIITDSKGNVVTDYLHYYIVEDKKDGNSSRAEYYESMWKEILMDKGKTESEATDYIKSKIVTALSADDDIEEAGVAKANGNLADYEKYRQKVIDYGFDSKDVQKAIDRFISAEAKLVSEIEDNEDRKQELIDNGFNEKGAEFVINKINESKSDDETGSTSVFDDTSEENELVMYSYSDLFDALINGDTENYSMIENYLIEKGGKTKQEIKSAMRSTSRTDKLWGEYIEASTGNDRQRTRELVTQLTRIYGSWDNAKTALKKYQNKIK